MAVENYQQQTYKKMTTINNCQQLQQKHSTVKNTQQQQQHATRSVQRVNVYRHVNHFG
jgi:hypothetical protein